MRGRPGRSFALLVGIGAGLELGGAGVAFFGLETMARCYWAWFPGVTRPRFPLACTRPIAGVGFHPFVRVAIPLGLLCATVILAGVRGAALAHSMRKADLILGPSAPEVPDELAGAAMRARAERVELRDDDEPYALCIGMLRPCIAVSTGLLGHLGREELAAVLAHEELHRRRRAPLRQLVARVTARALFFVPLLDDLLEVHLVEEEILADRTSSAIVGRRPLALALTKLASAPILLAGASGFGRVLALPYRVRALQDGSMPLPQVGLSRMDVSGISLGVLVVLVVWMPLSGLH
ncbi:MAG: M56 family metallopeptidase [Actinomycetota bacterium]|nr:M56 family metallopeptidase [Actinomycetota bacterium]